MTRPATAEEWEALDPDAVLECRLDYEFDRAKERRYEEREREGR